MIIGGILGILALGATLASSFMLWKVAGVAQSDLEIKTQEHTKAIGEQKTRVAELELGTAEANKRASEANQKAEEERLARVKLEQKLAPRRLSGEQTRIMSTILAAARPMNIAIVSRLLDFEGKDFADDFALVLNKSNWNAVRYENWTQSDKGIFIATAEGTKLMPEADALIAALDGAKIEYKIIVLAGEELHRMSPWAQPGVLYLLVGAKP